MYLLDDEQKIYELSYIDIMVTLYDMIKHDITIPTDEKHKILNCVYKLEDLIEQYSS